MLSQDSKFHSIRSDFNWLKMLRFYWADETETVYSRMAAANIPYYYEYLGAGGVLVLTPLTDRCYLCLMGAFQMDLAELRPDQPELARPRPQRIWPRRWPNSASSLIAQMAWTTR